MHAQETAGGVIGDVTCVSGQVFCISGSDGQIRAGGHQGLFIRDTRVLDSLVLTVNGAEPAPLAGRKSGSGSARFTSSWCPSKQLWTDPPVVVDRRRVVSDSLWEEISFTNFSLTELEFTVELGAGNDFAYIFDVKHGRLPTRKPGSAESGGLSFQWPEEQLWAHIRPNPPAAEVQQTDEGGLLRWHLRLAPRARWEITLAIGFSDRGEQTWATRTRATPHNGGARTKGRWSRLVVEVSEPAFSELVDQSTQDLASLLVPDPDEPEDSYFAAGSPWFLTLFGRDALWSAFMALPLGVDIAAQTLRVLARRQGSVRNRDIEEAPGKILHEMRVGGQSCRAGLAPVYYGTMDATPLFVIMLHEAWKWGLPIPQVRELLPNAERAMEWMRTDGDSDSDCLLEYIRSGPRGLANQGWKDSEDGIQFADGRLAEPPIALCEVQGYAHEAATRGAELLAAFDRAGAAQDWRNWATALREKFRSAFWVEDDEPYPAIALDSAKRRVDSATSNMGHLLVSGLLDEAECAMVARRLSESDLDSGWGLRTLSATSPRFNPLSYHGGSVWPHDTAIAVYNLAAAGHGQEAAQLLRGLVLASTFLGFQLPELIGGEQWEPGAFPIPYQAACRPQAWSAGAALLLLRSALGIYPHVPHGKLELRPIWPPPFRRLRLRGMRIAGGQLSLTVDREAGVMVEEAPPGLELTVHSGGHR